MKCTGAKQSIEQDFRAIGEKLIAVRQELGDLKKFRSWVRRHLPGVNYDTCAKWMMAAGADRYLVYPRPPSLDELLYKGLSAERRREAELARDMVDAGYRTLATKLHPDKGGSNEEMVLLNKVRERQKRFV